MFDFLIVILIFKLYVSILICNLTKQYNSSRATLEDIWLAVGSRIAD